MKRRLLLAASAAVGATAMVISPAGAYAPSRLLCTMSDARVTESSGVVASSSSDDWFWTHNDSGDIARFFAFRRDCTVPAEYRLPGAGASDWEDIARGPDSRGVMSLWMGDHGDNNANRPGIQVYRVDEPTSLTPGVTDLSWQRFDLTYEDGPHDCETLLIDPRDGRLYVVTKSYTGDSALYAADMPLSTTGPSVLRKAATMAFSSLYSAGEQPTEPPGATAIGGASLAATGGDIGPAGDRVVVRTYSDAYEWRIAPGQTVAAAMAPTAPVRRLTLAPQGQGEGIAYSRAGGSLVTTSEYAPSPAPGLAPVYIRDPDGGPEVTPPAPGVPEVGQPAALAAFGAIVALGVAFASRRRRRL